MFHHLTTASTCIAIVWSSSDLLGTCTLIYGSSVRVDDDPPPPQQCYSTTVLVIWPTPWCLWLTWCESGSPLGQYLLLFIFEFQMASRARCRGGSLRPPPSRATDYTSECFDLIRFSKTQPVAFAARNSATGCVMLLSFRDVYIYPFHDKHWHTTDNQPNSSVITRAGWSLTITERPAIILYWDHLVWFPPEGSGRHLFRRLRSYYKNWSGDEIPECDIAHLFCYLSCV